MPTRAPAGIIVCSGVLGASAAAHLAKDVGPFKVGGVAKVELGVAVEIDGRDRRAVVAGRDRAGRGDRGRVARYFDNWSMLQVVFVPRQSESRIIRRMLLAKMKRSFVEWVISGIKQSRVRE